MKINFKPFKTRHLTLCLIMAFALSTSNASAAKINDKLNIGGALWSELDLDFTSNSNSVAFDVDRARLTTKYKLDEKYDLSFAFDTASSGAIAIERAFLTHNRENGRSKMGYLRDEYISWLDAASGLRWVNVSLTQLGFRNRRALGVDYEHSFGEAGHLLIALQNGNDDAYGAGAAAADNSLNFTAAYKLALNEDLDGQAYFGFQNKDADSPNSPNAVVRFGTAIAGGGEVFKFLGEFAMIKEQVDGSAARLGFGVTATYAFRPLHHFYGRFYSGNKAAQDDATVLGGTIKNSFEIGLLKDLSEHLNAGLLGEFANTTTDTTNTNFKFRLAAKF